MNTFNQFRKFFNILMLRVRHTGFWRTIKFLFKKVTGVLECEREIETLNYIINHYIDITKFPPAQGEFRKMQLCDTALLAVFDAVCRKYNLSYWLHAGTLLGAVRHKGFIPWDDDIDVAMPRKDYDELCRIGHEVFSSCGDDDISFNFSVIMAQIKYNMEHTGVFLDVFPVDIVNSESDDESVNIELIRKKAEKYHSLWSYKNTMSYEQLNEKRNKIFGSDNIRDNEKTTAVFYPEFSFIYIADRYPSILYSDIVFPLGTIEFEGYTFNSPHDTHKYLTEFFGDYMKFPKSGLEHHVIGEGKMSELAEKNRADMNEVHERLKAIERYFRT